MRYQTILKLIQEPKTKAQISEVMGISIASVGIALTAMKKAGFVEQAKAHGYFSQGTYIALKPELTEEDITLVCSFAPYVARKIRNAIKAVPSSIFQMSAHPVPNNGRVIDFEQPHLTEKLVEQNKLIRKEKKTKAHLRAANPQMAANIGH